MVISFFPSSSSRFCIFSATAGFSQFSFHFRVCACLKNAIKEWKNTSFFGEMFRNRYQDSCTIGYLGLGLMARCSSSTVLFDNELLKFDYVNTFDLPQHWFSLEQKTDTYSKRFRVFFTGSMEIGVGCRTNHFPIWTSHQTHCGWLILCLKILFHNTSPW